MPLGISLSGGAEVSESITKYSKAFDKQRSAFGMSFVSRLEVDFHDPSLLLYRFWKATFFMLMVFPFFCIWFSNMEASMPPHMNFFSGFDMYITSIGLGNMFKYLILRIFIDESIQSSNYYPDIFRAEIRGFRPQIRLS